MPPSRPDYSFCGNKGLLSSMIENCSIRIQSYKNQIDYLQEKIKKEEAQIARYKNRTV